jgi:hypothetical protein
MMQETARLKEVTLVSEIEDGLPFVVADPSRVFEILINLLDNAVKFTPAGGTVTVQASRTTSDPDFVYFAVQDTGCGISPEARALIFERLYQDPQSVDSSRKGLGLGLFITRELVTLHGGRIWVASEAGQGATFSFTLPVYSLPKLLAPVLWDDGKLREAVVLLRMDLKPRSRPVLGDWKDVCTRSLELLQRCVYLDKDLVLPPMPGAGPDQTFFVVASTDVERVEIMSRRIREVMEKAFDWKTSGTFALTAQAIDLPRGGGPRDEQMKEVAERIATMVREALGPEKKSARKQGASAS